MLSHSRRDLQVAAAVAIVLGCSDSRAPAEIVFDQGLGDLFVIRVAGNIVAPSQVGSVEFAAERFGTRWSWSWATPGCGAIDATLEAIADDRARRRATCCRSSTACAPASSRCAQTDLANDPARLRREAMRANVRASVNHLRHGSAVIERLVESDGLAVVGAELDLASGDVIFFDGGLA